jgi:hypothetical protein
MTRTPGYWLPFFCLMLLSAALQAQQFKTVDMKDVEKRVTDKNSPSYYQILVNRFKADDTTMTMEDLRDLYYGEAFQDSYHPYSLPNHDISTLLDKGEYSRASGKCDSVLAVNPASVKINYLKGLALYYIDSTDKKNIGIYMRRYYHMLHVIESSGDGLTCATAFKTMYVPDEYEFMSDYELKSGDQALTTDLCDRFKVKPSRYFTAKEIYFDTSESFNSLTKEFKKKGKD